MEDLTTRQLPQAIEAEQSVLGSILIDSRCVGEVIGILQPEDFYLRQNREIYETIYQMFNYSRPIDPVTVIDQLKENGTYEEGTTTNYIRQLMEITPTAANVKYYANIVRDKAVLRALAQTATDINQLVMDQEGPASAILEVAERKVFSLRRGSADDALERIGTVMVKVFDHLNELAQSDREFPGYSTGIKDLDKKIHGLNDSDLIILAARPGMGKTTFALNILRSVAKQTGKTVAFFSLEMSREQLANRLLSAESTVENDKLITGRLEVEDWERISVAASALSRTDIRVDDNPAITVAEMNALCRRLDNLGLVIIDYLQLMTSAGPTSKGESRVQIVSDISRSLKIMAKELNVPVICLSQLSRDTVKRGGDKKPMLSDLRESGSIEQDADQVIFLHREDYYDENTQNKNICDCIVAKNRHGEPGTVKLQWTPQYFTFSDLETRHAEP